MKEDSPAPFCPLVISPVQAGFASSVEDYIETSLDLNRHLVKRPAATFFVRVEGNSMVDENIHSGDVLIVDRAEEAREGKIVIAVMEGEFTVKKLQYRQKKAYLISGNRAYPPIPINKECQIWGVVTYIIHKVP